MEQKKPELNEDIYDLKKKLKKKTAATRLMALIIIGLIAVNPIFWLLGANFFESLGSKGTPDKTYYYKNVRDILYNKSHNNKSHTNERLDNSPFQLGLTDKKTGYRKLGTYPAIISTTGLSPLQIEFAKTHLGTNINHSEKLLHTEDISYESVYNTLITKDNLEELYPDEEFKAGPADIALGLKPKKTDKMKYVEDSNSYKYVDITSKPICKDAVVFITHKDNNIDNLSSKDIEKIFTLDIENWSEVGGDDIPMVIYNRYEGTESFEIMKRTLGKNFYIYNDSEHVGGKNNYVFATTHDAMNGLSEVPHEYKNKPESIGYTTKYYMNTLYKNKDIKMLKVGGVSPTDKNIKSGKYPFSFNYYAVIRKEDKNKTGGKFMEWMLSKEGQESIKQAGYIKLK